MTLYPLLFRPILKSRIWGGRRLAELNKPLAAGEVIGESWEVADLPPEIEGGQSVVANGPLTGRTLNSVLEEHRPALLGSCADQPRFPLLIKYLDARENLSVQVHPDRAYVERHPEAHLKDEAWVVIDHDPGAVIYRGLRIRLDARTLRKRIESGEIANDLHAIEVKRGQCHYLPSGTIHALGAGVLVAEVQTPSDTTFRLFDWGRTSRELHIDEAIEVLLGEHADTEPGDRQLEPSPSAGDGLRAMPRPEKSSSDPQIVVNNICTTPLLDAKHFSLERIEATDDVSLEIVTSNRPEVWMILEGDVTVESSEIVEGHKGSTLLLPASMPPAVAQLRSGSSVLRVAMPSPTKGLIA